MKHFSFEVSLESRDCENATQLLRERLFQAAGPKLTANKRLPKLVRACGISYSVKFHLIDERTNRRKNGQTPGIEFGAF